MLRSFRIAPAFLFAVVLATSAVLADPVSAVKPQRIERVAWAPTRVLARFWSFLGSVWSKNGCEVDPSGRCTSSTGSVTTTGDNGCGADPNGLCK